MFAWAPAAVGAEGESRSGVIKYSVAVSPRVRMEESKNHHG